MAKYQDDIDFASSEEDEEQQLVGKSVKHRAKYSKLDWGSKDVLRTFDTSLEAAVFLEKKLKLNWRVKYRNENNEEYTVVMYCKKVKIRAKRQCSAKIALIYNARNQKVELKQSDDHDHSEIPIEDQAQRKVSLREEAVVRELVANGFKLGVIYKEVKKRFPCGSASYSQVQKLVKKHRAAISRPEFNLGELEDFLDDNLERPTKRHMDTAFVVKYELDEDEGTFR